MEVLLTAIATTVIGLMVGVELAVALVVNPILLRLPPDAGIAGRAHGARMLGRVMPVWYIGSLVLVVALAALSWGTATAVAAIAAAALLGLSVILSVALLVPINNRSMAWTPESRPDDWRDQQRRWDLLHTVRVAIIVPAFALVSVAAALL